MDASDFRERGKEIIDYIADYLENLKDRRTHPDVQQGFLLDCFPKEAPTEAESWNSVFDDVDKHIIPGLSHVRSPHFHGYIPLGHSYESLLGAILTEGLGTAVIKSDLSLSATELEIIVVDWLGKMLKLPESFLSRPKGGGAIVGSASEAILISLLAAKSKITEMQGEKSTDILNKLVCYCSDQAHYSVERACKFLSVKCHHVTSDASDCMQGAALQQAIQSDRENGLIPFCCVCTLGTTASCAFDSLEDIGLLCKSEKLWLHIDAAYAGSAFICPEFRPLLNGVEYADSFNFNAHKLMLVNVHCSVIWFRESQFFVDSYSVEASYMPTSCKDNLPELRNWNLGCTRKFRALKLWFVIRLFGVEGLQNHIRKHVSMAHDFESLVKADNRFTLTNDVKLGVVCFKLRESDDLNNMLVDKIQKDGRIYITSSESKGLYYLRFVAGLNKLASSDDVVFAWKVIQEYVADLSINSESR